MGEEHTIYVLSTDRERGEWLAISTCDPEVKATSYIGADEAVGRLVRNNPAISILKVVEILRD